MPPPPFDDDVRVIAAFLRGEPEAVALVDRWIAHAAGSFRGRLSSEWDDVLQDARLEALRLLQQRQYRGESSLKTYLWQVVGHVCIGVLRRRRRRPEVFAEELDSPLPSADPSPFERVLARERGERLLEALQSMTADCRQIWGMILEGLSYREISERIGASEGALRVRAHRCRQAAIEALERNASRGAAPKHD